MSAVERERRREREGEKEIEREKEKEIEREREGEREERDREKEREREGEKEIESERVGKESKVAVEVSLMRDCKIMTQLTSGIIMLLANTGRPPSKFGEVSNRRVRATYHTTHF